jgi:hypothetical protein
MRVDAVSAYTSFVLAQMISFLVREGYVRTLALG